MVSEVVAPAGSRHSHDEEVGQATEGHHGGVGNPFWPSGEEEALRGRCSTVVSCQPEEDTGKGAAGGQ
jgi:hypothetical protein